MTTLEALITGMIAGTLALRFRDDQNIGHGWSLDIPGYPDDETEARVVVRTSLGDEVLITVTETRRAPDAT